jgi:hypothetical protein
MILMLLKLLDFYRFRDKVAEVELLCFSSWGSSSYLDALFREERRERAGGADAFSAMVIESFSWNSIGKELLFWSKVSDN